MNLVIEMKEICPCCENVVFGCKFLSMLCGVQKWEGAPARRNVIPRDVINFSPATSQCVWVTFYKILSYKILHFLNIENIILLYYIITFRFLMLVGGGWPCCSAKFYWSVRNAKIFAHVWLFRIIKLSQRNPRAFSSKFGQVLQLKLGMGGSEKLWRYT